MSRPPNQSVYHPASVCNGGLIDFQDTAIRLPIPVEQPCNVQPVANMQAYTMQSNYMQPMQPMQTPTPFTQHQFMPPFNGMTQAQVLVGAPSELYAHGKVYRVVDEPAVGTASAVSPATASAATTPVVRERVISDREISKRVDDKIQEFMSKTKSLGASAKSNKTSTKDAFAAELKKINKQYSSGRSR